MTEAEQQFVVDCITQFLHEQLDWRSPNGRRLIEQDMERNPIRPIVSGWQAFKAGMFSPFASFGSTYIKKYQREFIRRYGHLE